MICESLLFTCDSASVEVVEDRGPVLHEARERL